MLRPISLVCFAALVGACSSNPVYGDPPIDDGGTHDAAVSTDVVASPDVVTPQDDVVTAADVVAPPTDTVTPPQDVVEYGARLLGLPVPPAIAFAEAELSPMARSFYADSKRVSNARLKQELGVRISHPTYREGLAAIAREMGM